MPRLLNMSSSSISDDNILNVIMKNECDGMLQTAMKTLRFKVLSMNNPTKPTEAAINKKLNDLQLLVSKINEAAKQKHAVIDQEFDEMQIMLDEEVKKQKLKIIETTCSVSRTFQYLSSNIRITASNRGYVPPLYDGNNGGLNESEIEILTESMENSISQIQQKYINQNNVDNNDDDEYDLNEIFSQIEEDGEMEPEPDYGYNQCQYINPVTFENSPHSDKKCANCESNGWSRKQEMDEMIKD